MEPNSLYNYDTFEAPKREDLVDTQGRYKTRSLFIELLDPVVWKKGYRALYTLREYEYQNLPSAYKLYMSCDTEYEFAMKLVGSLFHWDKLLNCPDFVSVLTIWRQHQEFRKTSLAEAQALHLLRQGGKLAAPVLKWFLAPESAEKIKKADDVKLIESDIDLDTRLIEHSKEQGIL